MKTNAIVVAAAKFKSRYLILKRKPEAKDNPNEWEFVSGNLEIGESAEDACKREILEETGLACKAITPGTKFEYQDKDTLWLISPFAVELESDEVQISDEHTEYKWVSEEELNEADKENGDKYLALVLSKI